MTELERLAAALDAGAAAGGVPVLATLVSAVGSSFRRPGARLIVMPDGSLAGAISGGCLEKDLAAHAEAVRHAREVKVVDYDLTSDDGPWGLGMGCAAKLRVVLEPCPVGAPGWMRDALRRLRVSEELAVVEVGAFGTAPARGSAEALLVDRIVSPPYVVACGDGPDADWLAKLAELTGWLSTLVRKDEPLPEATGNHLAVVLMTHNYERDRGLLERIIGSGTRAGYLGLLGPRTRTDRLLADLAAAGIAIDAAARERLHAPVGLDIGAESPEEVALAIVAEIRAAFSARPGGRLRERRGPIHGRP